jgi:diguanylate cyclase (GGDEF)-like protein/PAS domain S-box-containing protein
MAMLNRLVVTPTEAFVRWSVSLTSALPRGGSLPEDTWRRRHRSICLLLWLHVPVLIFFGATVGDLDLGHTVLEAAIVALLALGASLPNPKRNQRAVMATLGLMSSSAILVHFSHGVIEMHFHFFVMVVVVSLYQSWVPFLVALGYVVMHHGLFGWLDPSSVYNHPAAIANSWKWATVHGFFILGESVACLVAWRLNEDALEGERAARGAMEKANVDLAEAQAISQVGSWDWDIASGAVWWSDELYRIAGVEPESFQPTFESFLELVHPDERGRVKDIVDAACESRGRLDYECRIVRADGTTRVIQALGDCVVGDDGVLRKLIGTCQDVTDRKILEQEIQHRAFHDSLTGLANRALFLNRVEHALAVRERSPAPLAVLYLDLDDFKTVNDSLGHDVGDELLVEVSKLLRGSVRPSDTVARLGGDEFALLLEHTEQEGANLVSERILTALQEPVSLQSKDVFPHASIGVAVAEGSPKPDDLLRNADIAMYDAKRQGKNSYRAFHRSMLSSVVSRLELKAELQRAIENREFILHYQPLVDLKTGNIDKVEALIRWDHPERGMVPPADFMPLAEETGQIVPLGTWVIQEATQQAKALQQKSGRPISVSVNLSARQLDSNIVDQVSDALVQSQLEPRNLVLEITETTLMSQEETMMSKVEDLRSLGVRIAIDDFGTGYSSLGYLKQLPIDIIKIDRTFVSCITDGPEESALAHAIIKLAHIFNLEAVGEGIETAEQAEALKQLGCHSGQGYYFCRPIDAGELMKRALLWADSHQVSIAVSVS